jgi:hypothetical protein
MFPNVRLMIAAMVASVVALSCGFGVFAAFRVNHEPLVRLPPATAPLQLVADNATTRTVMAAAPEPFDFRFQINQPQNAGSATVSPTRERDNRDGAESAPAASAAVPERGAAEAEETAAVAQSTESAVVPIAPLTEGPMAKPVTPTADDRALGATEPGPAPAAAHADASSSSQETPSVAVIEPPADQALPAEQTKPDSELAPASVTKAAPEAAQEPVRKAAVSRTRRTRVAASGHRARRSRAGAFAQSDTQYLNQNSALSQPNFQTASQASQPRLAQRQQRRSKDNSRPTENTTSAAGGPFVSPPDR